jgi:XRE family aerobic/anaerobic benzoate catabolism transcriptional regulator
MSSQLRCWGCAGPGRARWAAGWRRSWGWASWELDAEVERDAGLSVGEIFELHGEASFRRREREALRRILAQGDRVVLATGGGLVTEPESFELVHRHCRSVWLRATPEEHWRRVVAQGDLRPMEGNRRAFEDLCAILEEREPLYERVELRVETSGRSVREVTEELAGVFGGGR